MHQHRDTDEFRAFTACTLANTTSNVQNIHMVAAKYTYGSCQNPLKLQIAAKEQLIRCLQLILLTVSCYLTGRKPDLLAQRQLLSQCCQHLLLGSPHPEETAQSRCDQLQPHAQLLAQSVQDHMSAAHHPPAEERKHCEVSIQLLCNVIMKPT